MAQPGPPDQFDGLHPAEDREAMVATEAAEQVVLDAEALAGVRIVMPSTGSPACAGGPAQAKVVRPARLASRLASSAGAQLTGLGVRGPPPPPGELCRKPQAALETLYAMALTSPHSLLVDVHHFASSLVKLGHHSVITFRHHGYPL